MAPEGIYFVNPDGRGGATIMTPDGRLIFVNPN
jgi:hypothetical protein